MQVIQRNMLLYTIQIFSRCTRFWKDICIIRWRSPITCYSAVVIRIAFGKINLTWNTAADNSKFAPIKLTILPVHENIVVTLAGQLTIFQCTMRIHYQEMFTNMQPRYSKWYAPLFFEHTKCPIGFITVSGSCINMHKNA